MPLGCAMEPTAKSDDTKPRPEPERQSVQHPVRLPTWHPHKGRQGPWPAPHAKRETQAPNRSATSPECMRTTHCSSTGPMRAMPSERWGAQSAAELPSTPSPGRTDLGETATKCAQDRRNTTPARESVNMVPPKGVMAPKPEGLIQRRRYSPLLSTGAHAAALPSPSSPPRKHALTLAPRRRAQ